MKFYYSFFLFFLLALPVFAQKGGTVRGNVFDKVSAEPISFASVGLEGTAFGSTTDLDGFFSISNVPAGKYTLAVTFLGYDKFTTEVQVAKGEIVFQNIYISESGEKLGEVVISGKKEQSRTQTQVSKLTVTPKQIRSLPSAGGEADIAQYLTVLPGVIFTGDQGGQLYIRGGSPVQNRILLDGMTIYNPFHSIGFFSVFETELIRNVDVYTGGFNAEYGGRVSAIVDVKTREGNRKRLAGQVSASPFQAKALIEGPLVKLKDDNGSSISFILTGKKALIDQTDEIFYNYVTDTTAAFRKAFFGNYDKYDNPDPNRNGIPFNYTDLYGKVSLLSGNGSKLNLFGFNYKDRVQFPSIDFAWQSSGGGMDFTLVPANSNTIVNGVLTYSKYDSQRDDQDRTPRKSSVGGYFAGLNFSNFGRDSEFKYGLALSGTTTSFEFINFRGLNAGQEPTNASELNVYLKYKQKFGPLIIEPGFRLQYYISLNDIAPEPRLGLKYNISDKLRFKAAGGLYSQNLLSTVDERDVVNLFVGFLSDPETRPYDPKDPTDTPDRLQKSWHTVAGFEYDINDNFELNLEGYYKKFTQLIALNRNKQTTTDPNYVKETGDAKGIDFSMKWEGKRAYIWGTYSLGFVRRDDGEQIYPPVFDRRHNMNALFTYQLGEKKQWELAVRWNFGSGFPFTLTQGFYTNYTFEDGIGTDIPGDNADLGVIFASERNGGRLPYYHRLDLSAKRIITFSKDSKLEINASITNAYNRPNIFYFDRIRYDRVNQLPVLPSISMSFDF